MRRLRGRLRSILLWAYQRLAPTEPPAPRETSEQFQKVKKFLQDVDPASDGDRSYLDTHIDRIATTLAMVPPGRRALELGTYMHMAPALQCVLGYSEVRGAYFGPIGRTDRKQVRVRGEVVFECLVDLFDAEKDVFPYADESYDCVLACEIIEHFLHDPMHMLFECWRVLVPGGALVITTPNVASATAVRRVLEMDDNPQLYSKYTDPRAPYAETEFSHMREYTPQELKRALTSAGFAVEQLFTTNAPGYPQPVWVLELLKNLNYSTELRGEQMYCLAQKVPDMPKTRYPGFLYEVS